MTDVRLQLHDVELRCKQLIGLERLGELGSFGVDIVSSEPLSPADVVGKPAILVVRGALGERRVAGMVWRVVAHATTDPGSERRYRIVLRSALATLELTRRSRIFQKLSIPDVVESLLSDFGLERELEGDYPVERYIVQYDERDDEFLRRMCERAGLFLRVEAGDEGEKLVLCDRSSSAPDAAIQELSLVDGGALDAGQATATHLRIQRAAVSGHVSVRDYDPTNPALRIEGEAKGGADFEQRSEVYRTALGAADAGRAAALAKLELEKLRANAARYELTTHAAVFVPGTKVRIDDKTEGDSLASPPSELFVVAARHEWTEDGDEYLVTLEGIGGDAVFRLEGRTPAPRIPGIDYAIVSGPPGDEVFADEDGCVRVRFLWDREAPSDETSSRPARVLQPNLAGSLLIPRVGWEVWVGFEDGDPERPVVLGRADNAKHPPALGLPENKTTTQIGTPSTPGAGTKQLLTFEDKAGKQGVSWLIGKGLTRTVANNMFTQTGGDETGFVGGAQLINVGTQKVSVKLASVSEMASQMLDITGTHDVSTGEAMHLKLGSETVACSSLIELVGDPANAVVDLVTTAAFAALGAKYSDGLGALVVVGGKAIVNGIKEGYTKGVVSGVVAAGKEVAGALPGVGDAFGFASDILEGAEMAPWQPGKHPWQLKEDEWKELEDKANEEFNAAAGGAGGGAAGPGDAGPGHRVTKVGGATLETIGGAYLIATPGGLKWTTLGMATYIVGGAHSTATARMSFLTAGASLISTGLFNVAAPAGIEKIAKVAYAGNIGGAHRTTAGKGAAFIAKGALSLTVDGALTHSGSKAIFKCGGSKVVIDGSGITMTAPKITYEDPVKASEASRG